MNGRRFTDKTDLSRFLQKGPNALLAKILPLWLYRQYIYLMGSCYYLLYSKERIMLTAAMKRVLANRYGRMKLWRVIIRTYLGIIEHYYEKMITAHASYSGIIDYAHRAISLAGARWIDAVKRDQRGCLFVTAHFGAVEFLPVFLAVKGYRPSMILKFKTNRLKQSLSERAARLDLHLIDAAEANVALKALDALKKGRTLITLCDEFSNWRPSGRHTTTLLGDTVPMDRTLDILYRRSQVPCCIGLMARRTADYQLMIHPLADGREPISIAQSACRVLEHYIYHHPEQWYQWPNVGLLSAMGAIHDTQNNRTKMRHQILAN